MGVSLKLLFLPRSSGGGYEKTRNVYSFFKLTENNGKKKRGFESGQDSSGKVGWWYGGGEGTTKGGKAATDRDHKTSTPRSSRKTGNRGAAGGTDASKLTRVWAA